MVAVAVGSIACATPDSRTEDERKADQAMAKQVQVALANEPYVDAAHINVAADRGVVRLSGLVATEFDLRQVLRTSAQVPGVRNVVDDLEIIDFGRRR
jgi:osmotically-inducible protein OsmY